MVAINSILTDSKHLLETSEVLEMGLDNGDHHYINGLSDQNFALLCNQLLTMKNLKEIKSDLLLTKLNHDRFLKLCSILPQLSNLETVDFGANSFIFDSKDQDREILGVDSINHLSSSLLQCGNLQTVYMENTSLSKLDYERLMAFVPMMGAAKLSTVALGGNNMHLFMPKITYNFFSEIHKNNPDKIINFLGELPPRGTKQEEKEFLKNPLKSLDQIRNLSERPSVTTDQAVGFLFKRQAEQEKEKTIKVYNPCLFKVSKGDVSFYVLGTCHLLDLSSFSENLQSILTSQEKLYTERVNFTIDDMLENEAITTDFLGKILVREGESGIYNSLPASDQSLLEKKLSKVKEILEKYGKSLNDVNTCYLYGMFFGIITTRVDGVASMDEELQTKYKEKGSNVFGLETSEAMFDMIESFGRDFVSLFSEKLKTTSLSSIYSTIEKSVAFSQMQYAFGEVSKDSFSRTQEVDDAVDRRTKNWFEDSIKPEYSKFNNSLIAVGCGHITSHSESLLRSLESDGFQIEKIDMDGISKSVSSVVECLETNLYSSKKNAPSVGK